LIDRTHLPSCLPSRRPQLRPGPAPGIRRFTMEARQEHALSLLKKRRTLLEEHKEAPSYRDLSRATGFPATTLFDWDHKDMSPEAVEERHRMQGAHPKLER
jgi:hypothetical protein